MKVSQRTALAFLLVASSLCTAAHAQWQWRDAGGTMVFSDQPPPTNVPLRSIIRAPRSTPPAEAAAPNAAPTATAAPAPAGSTAVSDQPKTTEEREAEIRKRQEQEAEAAKKAEFDKVDAEASLAVCSGLRRNLAMIESNQRITRIDEKGERSSVSDAERSTEATRIREQISLRCK